MTRERTIDRAQGRWREILPLLGIDPRFLANRHMGCPLCGGKDRFRFDDKDGSGSYYCNQCGAGNGIIMLRKKHGWDFKTACAEVDRIIGQYAPAAKATHVSHSDRRADRLAKLQKIIAEATEALVVAEELARRGLSTVPPVLLGHPALPYVDEGVYRGRYTAIVAPILGPDGQLQSCHRIYCADLKPRKKSMPAVDKITGGAVRLFEPTEVLGVAEGVETAIACYELFHVPVWSALTANGIESFVPPAGIKTLIVFGDNDRNFAGQKAAYALANRIVQQKIEVEVHIPPAAGTDWLNVHEARKT